MRIKKIIYLLTLFSWTSLTMNESNSDGQKTATGNKNFFFQDPTGNYPQDEFQKTETKHDKNPSFVLTHDWAEDLLNNIYDGNPIMVSDQKKSNTRKPFC